MNRTTKYFRRTLTIINPAAGVDTPLLGPLNRAIQENAIENEVLVTQKPEDLQRFAQRALRQKPDAVIVSGGDGTIVEVAKVLHGTDIPLIIIPGGTANILAKELNIPLNPTDALQVLSRRPVVKKINVGRQGRRPLFLRTEVGIMAKMVKQASPALKESLGIMAYPITALKEAMTAPVTNYTITVDGKKHITDGVGLMVANIGNIGVTGVSLQQKVKSDDGLLDVFVLRSSDLATLVALGSSALIGTDKPIKLQHWQGKKIHVSLPKRQTLVSDDTPIVTKSFTVTLDTKDLTIFV